MTRRAARCARLLALVLGASACVGAQAALVGYTSRGDFEAAVLGLGSGTTLKALDFESLPAHTPIGNGSSAGGITFAYDFGGVQLEVGAGFPTTSGTRYLGTDDGGVLQDGDDLTLSFAATQAFGMYLISADPLFDGDFTLSVNDQQVALQAAGVQQTLADGARVFFLGLVDDNAGFSGAALVTVGLGAFFYNVDDIVYAQQGGAPVPLPGTLSLLACAALLGSVRHRWTTNEPRFDRRKT